jgi:hypothetical protein
MRGRLQHDPFEPFAYRALFKIFNWRKAPDAAFCAAQILEALGAAEPEERRFLDSHRAAVGAPGSALADPDHDEWLFPRTIPGGFRHVFRLLGDALTRYYPGDLKAHGVTRSDRIASVDHPLRRIGDALAAEMGIPSYEAYLFPSQPAALIVENTDPPAILIGKLLLHEATEEELLFIMGRALWVIRKSMILPATLAPEELELLVAGIVRQYNPDFQPGEADPKRLHAKSLCRSRWSARQARISSGQRAAPSCTPQTARGSWRRARSWAPSRCSPKWAERRAGSRIQRGASRCFRAALRLRSCSGSPSRTITWSCERGCRLLSDRPRLGHGRHGLSTYL